MDANRRRCGIEMGKEARIQRLFFGSRGGGGQPTWSAVQSGHPFLSHTHTQRDAQRAAAKPLAHYATDTCAGEAHTHTTHKYNKQANKTRGKISTKLVAAPVGELNDVLGATCPRTSNSMR